AVEQDPTVAGLDQMLRAGHFAGGAQKCDFHRRSVASRSSDSQHRLGLTPTPRRGLNERAQFWDARRDLKHPGSFKDPGCCPTISARSFSAVILAFFHTAKTL